VTHTTDFIDITALQAAVGQVVSRPWRSSWTKKSQSSVQNDEAATHNVVKIVVTLVLANADVNAAGSRAFDGRTALQEATKRGQLEVIDVLKGAEAKL
jgi:hypothetical protein